MATTGGIENRAANDNYRVPTDHYWVRDTGERFVEHINARADEMYSFMSNSNFRSRIARSWQYYHGQFYDRGHAGATEIQYSGDEEGLQLVSANHYRSIINLLVTYIIQGKVAWDAMAENSEHKTQEATKIANMVLDHYENAEELNDKVKTAVQYALVMTSGFIYIRWDRAKGAAVAGIPERDEIMYESEIDYSVHHTFDCVFDYTAREFESSPWACIRRQANRWDLVEQYRSKKDQIIKWDRDAENIDIKTRFGGGGSFNEGQIASETSDIVDVWDFWHKPTPALPKGKFASFLRSGVMLEEGPNPYGIIPIERIVPQKYLTTAFGFTPAFDMQGPQEGLNAELSVIMTNHNNIGPAKWWFESGETINIVELEPGVTAIQTEKKPEILSQNITPQEFFQAVEMWISMLEYTSGVNSASRGEPQKSLRAGVSLALMEARTQQAANTLVKNYHKLLRGIGRCTLKILHVEMRGDEERVLSIVGRNKRRKVAYFTGDDLSGVSNVNVQVGSPLMTTLAGRRELIELFLQYGLITNREEIVSILETGQIDSFLEIPDSQLSIVHDENDRILKGQVIPQAQWIDNHLFHISSHAVLLDTVGARSEDKVAPFVHGHILDHIEKLMSPMGIQFQALMGYPVPPHLQPMLMQTGMVPPPPAEGSPSPSPGAGPGPAAGANNPGGGAGPTGPAPIMGEPGGPPNSPAEINQDAKAMLADAMTTAGAPTS